MVITIANEVSVIQQRDPDELLVSFRDFTDNILTVQYCGMTQNITV